MEPHPELRSERRGEPRVPADCPAELSFGEQVLQARVRDISLSGVRCVTDRAWPLMTQVQLVILLPGTGGSRRIACEGAVVRSEPIRHALVGDALPAGHVPDASRAQAGFDTAIFFTHLGEDGRTEMQGFVDLQQNAESQPLA